MQMIVLAHKQNVAHTQHKTNRNKIAPMPGRCVRNQDQAGANGQLQDSIDGRYQRMLHTQLVGHQLIGVLAVRLAQILVQHDSVADSQDRIHTIYSQEHNVRKVARLQNQFAQQENHDERSANAAHVAGKTLGFTFGPEVKETEHQVGQNSNNDQTLRRKAQRLIQPSQWQQQCQRISAINSVNTIHKIVSIGNTHAYYQSNQNGPPHIPLHNTPAPEHQCHSRKLEHQPNAIG